MKKLKYIIKIKLHYIIFDFLYNFTFLNKTNDKN
jgi:hypothetical protein